MNAQALRRNVTDPRKVDVQVACALIGARNYDPLGVRDDQVTFDPVLPIVIRCHSDSSSRLEVP